MQKRESLPQPRKPRRCACCCEAPRHPYVSQYLASIPEDKPGFEAHFEMQLNRKRCGQFRFVSEGQKDTTTLFSKDCLLLKVQPRGDVVGPPSSLLSHLPCPSEQGVHCADFSAARCITSRILVVSLKDDTTCRSISWGKCHLSFHHPLVSHQLSFSKHGGWAMAPTCLSICMA